MAGRTVWARGVESTGGARLPIFTGQRIAENDPTAQRITSELYGGGSEERIAQELLLGIGGMRVVRALVSVRRSSIS
jgi:starch phosphorylase